MPRSVNAVASRARRKKVLKQTKGNFGSRRNVITVAKNTLVCIPRQEEEKWSLQGLVDSKN
jgi:ribosomal protein L20